MFLLLVLFVLYWLRHVFSPNIFGLLIPGHMFSDGLGSLLFQMDCSLYSGITGHLYHHRNSTRYGGSNVLWPLGVSEDMVVFSVSSMACAEQKQRSQLLDNRSTDFEVMQFC
jgi:hypothetical protein